MGGIVPGHAQAYSVQVPDKVTVGEPFEINVDGEEDFSRCIVKYSGRELPVDLKDGRGVSLLMGAGLQKKDEIQVLFEFRGPEKKRSVSRKIKVKEKEYPEQHLELPEDKVSFGKKTLDRIYKEKGVVQSALSIMSPYKDFNEKFVWPVKGKILSRFGLRRFLNGKPRSPHRGLDLRASRGTEIKACNTGKVALTGNFFFGGNTVVLDHGQGILSLYMHLNTVRVKQGEKIQAGSPVGTAGSTGRATGPHLHFALCTWGEMVNPLSVLPKLK